MNKPTSREVNAVSFKLFNKFTQDERDIEELKEYLETEIASWAFDRGYCAAVDDMTEALKKFKKVHPCKK